MLLPENIGLGIGICIDKQNMYLDNFKEAVVDRKLVNSQSLLQIDCL